MLERVSPRNLTARAAYKAVGNPANTRLESAIGNCFPGLELDVRDLDRRFFPGLVFNAVRIPLNPVPDAFPETQGFHLVFVDYMYDPMLPDDSGEPWVQKLLAGYRGAIGNALGKGRWYLDWVEQAGKRFVMRDANGAPYDGMLVWRFIRSLEAGPDDPITISLVRRDADADHPQPPVQLTGRRRRYRTDAGVFDASYQAGELTQSLCNPWSHDFRDCGCHYWPSNHPDVVMAEASPDQALPDGQPRDPVRAETYLDWLRADRGPSGAAAARNTVEKNRPYQVDHYEINQMWEDLPFVLEGREIDDVYRRDREPPPPNSYPSREAMIDALRTSLAPMEMTLAMEYLYAYFSLADPDETRDDRWPTLKDDLVFARRALISVAVGEMTHLRWANQLLWELDKDSYEPVIEPIPSIVFGASRDKRHDRALEPLWPKVLDRFIEIERPGGSIDRAYAQCVATLRQPEYPVHLYELAVRIDTDGNHHYLRFTHLREVLKKYGDAHYPYLRPIELGSNNDARDALELFDGIQGGLKKAYLAEARRDYAAAQNNLNTVRKEMDRFRRAAEELARRRIGIPFWRDDGP